MPEAAEYLNAPYRFIRRLVEEKRVPSYMYANRRYLEPDDHELAAVGDERFAQEHALGLEQRTGSNVEDAAGGVGAGEHRRRGTGAPVGPPVLQERVMDLAGSGLADDLSGGVG